MCQVLHAFASFQRGHVYQSATLSASSSTAACCNVHLSWCYQYWQWLAFWQASYHSSGWCSNSGNEKVQFYFFSLHSFNKSTVYKVLIVLLGVVSVIKPLSELIWHSLQSLNNTLRHIRSWLPTAVVGLSTDSQQDLLEGEVCNGLCNITGKETFIWNTRVALL